MALSLGLGSSQSSLVSQYGKQTLGLIRLKAFSNLRSSYAEVNHSLLGHTDVVDKRKWRPIADAAVR